MVKWLAVGLVVVVGLLIMVKKGGCGCCGKK